MLALFYVLLAGVYIVISSLAVADAFEGEAAVIRVEMTKGLVFVGVTGIALFVGARFLLSHIARQSREIERQRHSIEKLDKRAATGLLASAIGHDANNLLSAVSMSLELLERGVEPERQRQIIQSLDSVVDELVVLNERLVRGGWAEQPGELKEHSLIHESERVMQFVGHEHPVRKLQISFSHSGEVTAKLNRHLYVQVMFNMLTNCVRHAGPAAKVQVHVEDCGDKVSVMVEDDGPGVPEDLRERIFEPYYSNHAEGAGVGLASVRSIIRMHRGDIRCESSDKLGGAKFIMHFPKNASTAVAGENAATSPLSA